MRFFNKIQRYFYNLKLKQNVNKKPTITYFSNGFDTFENTEINNNPCKQ